tara:strand:- start:355 stop:1686 length:1332 start_codon:yes stop_codon:yes gene_type:complete
MESERPLKRSLAGLEIEMFVLDNQGKVVSKADELIKATKKINKKCNIVKEMMLDIVEFGAFPSVKVQNTGTDLLNNLSNALEAASKLDLRLFPLATYPGKFNPESRKEGHYGIKTKIWGEKLGIEGRCTGFHFHYEMPKGVFNKRTKFIKEMVRSKNKEALLHSYNCLIALDPVFTTLMQSSPYYQGRFYGKDSRVIWYRGGKKLKNTDGLFANLQMLGGLQPYKQTVTDLIQTIDKKYDKWTKLAKSVAPDENIQKYYPSKLIPMWNPVKLNPHGTLEYRGMDMNHPKYVLGACVLLKDILKFIQRDFIIVLPSDIGIDEPFKIEGNVMYVPPHSYVRNVLQYEAAYKGYESKLIRNYINKFMRTVSQLTLDKYQPTVEKLKQQTKREKSTSDIILKRTKKMGYGLTDELTQEDAAELALKSSRNMLKEVEETRKNIEDLED